MKPASSRSKIAGELRRGLAIATFGRVGGPYLALIAIYLRLALRDRSVIFFNYLFPLVFFFAFGSMLHAERGATTTAVVTSVLVIGVLGNGLFGAGLRAVQDREAGILRRFKVAPISPLPLLVASLISGWLLYLPNLLLILTLAHFMYGMPLPADPISLFVFLSVGVLAFRAMGLIIGSVANSMAESNVLVQLLYMPMMFLSGATIPVAILPGWVQVVAAFVPAFYLVNGSQGILQRRESLRSNAASLGALVLTLILGTFIAKQLFRWDKEEKLKGSAKAWVAAVLVPFILLGLNEVRSHDQRTRVQTLFRHQQRQGTLLIRGARIFVGDGRVIESGAVLVRGGRIADVYEGAGPDPASLSAEVVEAAGKTVLPGLIDVHVHLGSPGGIYADPGDYASPHAGPRALAQYLYSGITTVRSVGDTLDTSLALRDRVKQGELLGAELFVSGPMFTAPGGHGTEYTRNLPESIRPMVEGQLVRTPKTPDEARQQVHELAAVHVDGLKAILEAGRTGMLFERLDLGLFKAIAEDARAQNLPLAVHTGDSQDLSDALNAGVASIEHGPRDRISDELLRRMVSSSTAYDPTLSVWDALAELSAGQTELLERTLVQQVVPQTLLTSTRTFIKEGKAADAGRAAAVRQLLRLGGENLLRAHAAGVMLVAGSDAGNLLVFHGPTIHRELQLWVAAGVPPAAALQAATGNAARLLRSESRIGLIARDHDADLLIVDGNPLTDISTTERISLVVFKGERIRRAALFGDTDR